MLQGNETKAQFLSSNLLRRTIEWQSYIRNRHVTAANQFNYFVNDRSDQQRHYETTKFIVLNRNVALNRPRRRTSLHKCQLLNDVLLKLVIPSEL